MLNRCLASDFALLQCSKLCLRNLNFRVKLTTLRKSNAAIVAFLQKLCVHCFQKANCCVKFFDAVAQASSLLRNCTRRGAGVALLYVLRICAFAVCAIAVQLACNNCVLAFALHVVCFVLLLLCAHYSSFSVLCKIFVCLMRFNVTDVKEVKYKKMLAFAASCATMQLLAVKGTNT